MFLFEPPWAFFKVFRLRWPLRHGRVLLHQPSINDYHIVWGLAKPAVKFPDENGTAGHFLKFLFAAPIKSIFYTVSVHYRTFLPTIIRYFRFVNHL